MGRKASHRTFWLSTSAPAKISFNFSLMGKSLKGKHVKWLIINVQLQKKIHCNEAGCMFQHASVAKGEVTWAFGSWCVSWQMYMCAYLCCGACSFVRCLVRMFPQGVSSQPYSPCHGYATPVTPLDTCDTRLEVLHKPNAMGALEWKNLRKW